MLTVLVADDDFAHLEALSTALVAAGHRVLRAGDGGDALRILTSQRCEVVVCDEDMPVLDGAQLVGAMRATARLAEIPVIVMAAEPLVLEGALVIAKPVELTELLAAIARAAR